MDTQETTLLDRLFQLQEEDGEREAFVFYNTAFERSSITRNELVRLASKFAHVLNNSGIGYKDGVINTVPNSLERLVTDFGIIMAGAAPINSIPALTSGEIFFSTAHRSEAKAVIVYPSSSENSDWNLVKDGVLDKVHQVNGSGIVLKQDQKESMEETKQKRNGLGESLQFINIVYDYRSEQAPHMTKAIVLSRRTNWQLKNIPEVPHFMEFLANRGDDQLFLERRVVPSDVGYYHTTTGTTGMQKIVPRSHSSLLKVAETVGQMAPCRVPILFVTLSLGWNSGFPYMFFHFGSICVMIDNLDLVHSKAKNAEQIGLTKNVTVRDKISLEDDKIKHSSNLNKTQRHTRLPEKSDIVVGETSENRKESNGHVDITKGDTQRGDFDLPRSDFIYEVYWHAINTDSIPFAHLSPTEIDGLARVNARIESQGQQPSNKVAFLVTGGLPIKESVVSSALEQVCQNVVVFYGMTEAGVLSYNVISNAERYSEGQCGRLYRGVQCRITDDSGNVLPTGQAGNIEFKTETMFSGFFRNVEKTKEAFTRDGWFVTEDLGFFKDDDTLTVLCRKDDVILHGCILIYPTAIEAVLRRCRGVQDVVVVPVPDKLKHQNVCACVIRVAGEAITEQDVISNMDALLAFPRNAEIQTPHHVVFMDSFPYVQNTKIDRKLLTQIAVERIGCQRQSF